MSAPTAVLVMSYGSPARPEDIESYYTDVRRGRPPSAEQLADLERRYRAIGGVSPLAERTAAQARAIGRALDSGAPGSYQVFVGTKHGRPSIEEAVDEIATRGASELVGLVLAPHYSDLSVGEYLERASRRAEHHGLRTGFVRSWHDEPELVALLAERLERALGRREARPEHAGPVHAGPEDAGPASEHAVVVFTAHSLPERVARACQLDEAGISWQVGWQSAGRTPEPWIGPDILALLHDLAAAGAERVIVCPAGFTADHLEVLYDLDVEASALARSLGIDFCRTESLNDDPRLAALLARRVLSTAPSEP
jgi:ferrochelatase